MAPHPTTVAFPVKVWPDKGSLRRCHSGQLQNDSNNSVWDYYVKHHLADPTNELISKGDSSSIRQMSSSMLLSFQSGWIVIAFDVYLVQTWVLDKDPNFTKNLTPAPDIGLWTSCDCLKKLDFLDHCNKKFDHLHIPHLLSLFLEENIVLASNNLNLKNFQVLFWIFS